MRAVRWFEISLKVIVLLSVASTVSFADVVPSGPPPLNTIPFAQRVVPQDCPTCAPTGFNENMMPALNVFNLTPPSTSLYNTQPQQSIFTQETFRMTPAVPYAQPAAWNIGSGPYSNQGLNTSVTNAHSLFYGAMNPYMNFLNPLGSWLSPVSGF